MPTWGALQCAAWPGGAGLRLNLRYGVHHSPSACLPAHNRNRCDRLRILVDNSSYIVKYRQYILCRDVKDMGQQMGYRSLEWNWPKEAMNRPIWASIVDGAKLF